MTFSDVRQPKTSSIVRLETLLWTNHERHGRSDRTSLAIDG